MRVLLLTDIHGDTDKLGKILDEEEYEAVLCAGDLGDANKFEDYGSNLVEVLETLDRKKKMTKAVPGNMDPEEDCVRQLINYRMNIHKKIASFETFEVVGFGGGQTPFSTPFEPSDSEITGALETLYPRLQSDIKIGVIHQPPIDTDLDVVDGEHVGSPGVKKLLEDMDFDLVLTGHIHEARGREEINGTLVVNPGAVLDGYYGLADIEESGLDVELKKL